MWKRPSLKTKKTSVEKYLIWKSETILHFPRSFSIKQDFRGKETSLTYTSPTGRNTYLQHTQVKMCDLWKKNKRRNVCESHGSENSDPLKPCPLPSCHTLRTCMLNIKLQRKKLRHRLHLKGSSWENPKEIGEKKSG